MPKVGERETEVSTGGAVAYDHTPKDPVAWETVLG